MAVRPRIAEVSCSRIQFQPGDRVLVRVYHDLDEEEKSKLRRTITRWAGCDVEILIFNGLAMDVKVEKR